MYLNLIQVAESFGVSESAVLGWMKHDGLPFTQDRDRYLFDRAQVAQWAARRGMATKVGFLAPDPAAAAPFLKLGPLIRAGKVWRDVAPADLTGVYEQIVASLPGVTEPIRHLLGQRVRAHGGVTLAPVGGGIARPHPSDSLALGHDAGTIALIFLREGLRPDDTAVDDVPVRRLFFFVSPSPRGHFDILANLSRGIVKGSLRQLAEREAPDEEIFHAFDAIDEATGKKA